MEKMKRVSTWAFLYGHRSEAADTITGTASHLNFSNSADGQNGGGASCT